MKSIRLILPAVTVFLSFALCFAAHAASDNGTEANREPSAAKKEAPAEAASSGADGASTNIRASMALLIGYLNVDLDFKTNENWSVGPTISYWHFDIDSTSGSFTSNKLSATRSAVGVRANWAKNGIFNSGLYLSPILQYVQAEVSGTSISTGNKITGRASGVVLTGLVGYQFFGANWNASVGAGLGVGQATSVEVNDGTTTTSYRASGAGGSLAIDLMVGYAF